MTSGRRWCERRATTAVAVAALALAGLYSVLTPIWEAPDEVGHMAYIVHLVRTHALPVQSAGRVGEEHQPPLYYLIAAIPVALLADLDDARGAFRFNPRVAWGLAGGSDVNAARHESDEGFPYSGQVLAVHLARLVSVVLAAATVLLTIAIGRVAVPEQPIVGLLAGALVATTPQFAFVAGAVNNDNLANALAAGLILTTVVAVTGPVTTAGWLAAGTLTAAGLLTKLSIVPIAALTFVVLSIVSLRTRSYRALWRGGASALLVITVLAGWWFARNLRLYGDPLGWQTFAQTFGMLLRDDSFQLREYRWFVDTQLRSFWGVFGWMTVHPPGQFYVWPVLVALVSAVGLGLWASGRSHLARTPRALRVAVVLGAAVVIQEAYLAVAVRTFGGSWFQGRYLFPAIAPIAVLVAVGLMAVAPPRRRVVVAGALAATSASVALWGILHVIARAY